MPHPIPIHDAIKNGDLEGVKALINQGHSLHRRDPHGLTVLHCAAEAGNGEIARELLRAGADHTARMDWDLDPEPDDSDDEMELPMEEHPGLTPLHLAALRGNVEVVRALMEVPGIDLEANGVLFWQCSGTALLAASAGQEAPSAEVFILESDEDEDENFDVKPNAEDSCAEICLLLLDAGANPNARDDSGNNILHHCVRCQGKGNDRLRVMERALALGADPNAECLDESHHQASNGYLRGTPLCIAVQRGLYEAVELLLKSGADLRPGMSLDGPVPLISMAPRAGSFKVFELLLSAGCDVKDVDDRGCDVVDACIQYGSDFHRADVNAILRLAVEKGADINRKFYRSKQHIHHAVMRREPSLISVLVELGADVNACDDEGMTPLHCAFERCNDVICAETVQPLLDAGADVFARNKAGLTPLQMLAPKAIRAVKHQRVDVPWRVPRITHAMQQRAIATLTKTVAVLVAAGDRNWDLVPTPCPGLEAALPAVWEAAPQELGQLFQRLEAPVQARIRTALIALHRVFPRMPKHVLMDIICAAIV